VQIRLDFEAAEESFESDRFGRSYTGGRFSDQKSRISPLECGGTIIS